jgi:UDP-N-acetylglucosamine 2-epimerase
VIHVFIGTKAQYIKTAPVLREMDERAISYRLVDSGQHGEFSKRLRTTLGVREPDVFVSGTQDITTVKAAIRWALSLSLRALRKRSLRSHVFAGDSDGICVVHGDTPTALISAVLAKRAGLKVAHLESGLRSRSLIHPFPEELIRIGVMRIADVLFAPDDTAISNLASMRIRGAIVPTQGNTSVEALRFALQDGVVHGQGPAILTTHRVENIKNRERMTRFVRLLEEAANRRPSVFVMHPPTRVALETFDLMDKVRSSGVEVVDLVDHGVFAEMLASAPFVVSDGGSIQEECALIGVPTLAWRMKSERLDGLGSNVVLSEFDEEIIEEFLRSYDSFRRPPRSMIAYPSEEIVDVLEGWA